MRAVCLPLEKVDFPESAKMMIRIEPVKPKGLLKLAEELEKKQADLFLPVKEGLRYERCS